MQGRAWLGHAGRAARGRKREQRRRGRGGRQRQRARAPGGLRALPSAPSQPSKALAEPSRPGARPRAPAAASAGCAPCPARGALACWQGRQSGGSSLAAGLRSACPELVALQARSALGKRSEEQRGGRSSPRLGPQRLAPRAKRAAPRAESKPAKT